MRISPKLYWRLSALPELGHLTPDERRRLLGRHVGGWGQVRMALRAGVLGLLLAAVVTGLGACLGGSIHPSLAQAWVYLSPLWAVLGVLGVYQFWMRIIRVDLQRHLKQTFQKGGLPVCLNCGYDLRAATGDACPECGARIVWEQK